MKTVSLLAIILLSFKFQVNHEKTPSFELIVFEGSDWCINCIKLEEKILSDSVFINFLEKENIKIIKIDFPQRIKETKEQKRINKSYAEKYEFTGVFPTVVISRTEPFSYKKLTYENSTISQFIEQIYESLKEI